METSSRSNSEWLEAIRLDQGLAGAIVEGSACYGSSLHGDIPVCVSLELEGMEKQLPKKIVVRDKEDGNIIEITYTDIRICEDMLRFVLKRIGEKEKRERKEKE